MPTSVRSLRSMSAGFAAGAVLLGAAAHAQVVPNERIGIADITPAGAFMIASVPDYPAAKAAMERSELGKLWARPQIRDFLSGMLKETFSGDEAAPDAGGLWGWLTENIDVDDLREPAGALGMALFAAKVPDPDDADAEPVDRVQGLLMADFGNEADAMNEVIDETLERLEREGRISLDEDDHDGIDIRIITVIVKEEEEEDPDLAAFRAEFGDERDRSMDAFNTILLATAGGRMVASTDRAALEGALDRIAGRRVASIADDQTYRAALAQHGADQHATLVLLVSDFIRESFQEGVGASLAMFPLPLAPAAMLDTLGLGAVQGAGMGVRFDTDAGSVEQSLALLAPQKKGLLTLIDSGLTRFDPPAFVPADAMSAWSVALRFDRVGDLARGIIRSLPPELQEQVMGGFDQIIAPVFASLGSELHVVQTLSRPLGPESVGSFVAIRLTDALTLANTINGFAGMLGLTPRDFEGNQLFEGEGPGQPSIGIGFDHVFIGPVEAIENAMRLAARPDTPRLAAAPRFTRATAPLGAGGALYYYDNMDESLAWSYWSMQNAEKAFAAQLEGWGLDAETRAEFLDDLREGQPEWHKNLPPIQMLLEHLGDSVMELRPTPDGFRGRAIIHRPAPR